MSGAEIAMVAISAFGTAYAVSSQMRAADAQERAAAEAERLARENAAAIEAETREEARRLALQQKQLEGTSRARAAASGITSSGSFGDYMSFLEQENQRQLEWLNESGQRRADIARRGGYLDAASARTGAHASRAQAWGSIFSGAKDIYGYGRNAGWWAKA